MNKLNTYIRFGLIPKSGRSINYLKLSGNQRRDLTEMMEFSDKEPEEVLKDCIDTFGWKKTLEDCLESGLSVFKADENGLPVIETFEQAESLAHRIGNKKIFRVSGQQIGVGQDGEPLISANHSEQITIADESLQNVIHEYLRSNFTVTETEEADNPNSLYTFTDYKTNKRYHMYMGVHYE